MPLPVTIHAHANPPLIVVGMNCNPYRRTEIYFSQYLFGKYVLSRV